MQNKSSELKFISGSKSKAAMKDERFEASDTQFTTLATHYDELMQTVPYDQWVEYVLLLLDMVEHRPRNILDCACGTGNVSFELAYRGFDVTGVDLSTDMIAVAQAKAALTDLPIRFFRADLTNFQLNRRFDTTTCLYDSLNYILDPAALQSAFAQVAAHIESGGVFVFDMNSTFALSADLFTQRDLDPRKKLHYRWIADFDEATQICSVQMHFERRDTDDNIEIFTETHRERAYPIAEIEAMLTATGWRLEQTYDAYTLNRPHARSERWYFVARRL